MALGDPATGSWLKSEADVDDRNLWECVKRTIIPLGQPRTGFPRLYPAQEPTVIDLHGYTIHGAFAVVNRAISRATRAKVKTLTVITGRSGEICREFPVWAALHGDVRTCTSLNGGGAFLLKLRPR